jgi:hypothetical protein
MTVNSRVELHRLIDILPDSLLTEVTRFVEILLFKLQRQPSIPSNDESETPLIDSLTFNQFLALPNSEKNQIWHETIERNKTTRQNPEQHQALFKQLCDTVQARHLFATMSKDDILAELRRTREDVWLEQHAD